MGTNSRKYRQLAEKFGTILHELQCTLVLDADKKGRLIFLSGGQNGLVRQTSKLHDVHCLAVHKDQVAMWRRKRFSVVNRDLFLRQERKQSDVLSFFPSKPFSTAPSITELHHGNDGWWGLDAAGTRLGLIADSGAFTEKWRSPGQKGESSFLNGLAMHEGRPAYVTSPGKGGEHGFIMDVPEGETVAVDLVAPTAPFLFADELYFLSGNPTKIMVTDPVRGKKDTVLDLPGKARLLTRHGEYLFTVVTFAELGAKVDRRLLCGARMALCAFHLPSARLVGMLPLRDGEKVNLLQAVSMIPEQARPMARYRVGAAAGLIAALIFSQQPSDLYAAGPLFKEKVPNIPLQGGDVGWNASPSFVDIDGDGDLDAFVGEYYGSIKYFENTGNASTPAFLERTGSANPLNVDVGYLCNPVFADFDGDGDLDALIGEANGTFMYYANTGNASAPAFTLQTGPGVNPLNGFDAGFLSSPTFVDIDGDGDLDAFSGEYYGTVKFYENTSTTTTSPAFIERTGSANPLTGVDVGSYSHPTFADLDGDGDFDSFIGTEDGDVRYFENTGTATSPAFILRTGSANPLNGVDVSWTSTPSFVDIDGDGDLDAFIGEYMGEVKAFKNKGNSTSPSMAVWTDPSVPLSGFDVGVYNTPTFIDIDGDGDLDAFAGEYYGTVKYFANTGNASNPAFTEATGMSNPLYGAEVGYYSAPCFVDIDSDGDLDVFVGEYYGTIKYFANTGNASSPSFVQVTGSANPLVDADVGFRSTPSFVDIDGDGDLDAFVGEYYGTVKYFENTGTTTSPAFLEQSGSFNPLNGANVDYNTAPTFVDLDGDGDFDAFIGNWYGDVRYFENTGDFSTPAFIERTGGNNPLAGVDVGNASTPNFVDIDNDGDADVFIGNFNGWTTYLTNIPSGGFSWNLFLPAIIKKNK